MAIIKREKAERTTNTNAAKKHKTNTKFTQQPPLGRGGEHEGGGGIIIKIHKQAAAKERQAKGIKIHQTCR